MSVSGMMDTVGEGGDKTKTDLAGRKEGRKEGRSFYDCSTLWFIKQINTESCFACPLTMDACGRIIPILIRVRIVGDVLWKNIAVSPVPVAVFFWREPIVSCDTSFWHTGDWWC